MMIVEYLIDNDKYKKLLDKINFIASNGKEVIYKSRKTNGKDNFFLKLSCVADKLEAAQALSDISIQLEGVFRNNHVKYRLLTNEASQFFAQDLYPHVCEFETKLRKFINCTLFDVDDEANKRAFKKLQDMGLIDKNEKYTKHKDLLSDTTLGDLFAFLFSNEALFDKIAEYKYRKFATREDLLDFIQKRPEKSIWELLFVSDFGDSKIPLLANKISDCRNEVMHFHNISFQQYNEYLTILKEGIADLDKQIKKGIVLESTAENVGKLSENVNYIQGIRNSAVLMAAVTAKVLQGLTNPDYLEALQNIAEVTSRFYRFDYSKTLAPLQELALKFAISNIATNSPSNEEVEQDDESSEEEPTETEENKDSE